MARVMVVHRNYRLRGGEDAFLEEQLLPTLARLGHETVLLRFPALGSFLRNPTAFLEVLLMVVGAERLRPSFKAFKSLFERTRPSIVILNNFIPTVSLAIPEETRRQKIRSIAWSHNARLICANGLTFDGAQACTACIDSGSAAILNKACFDSKLQAALYALIYRKRRITKKLVGLVDTWAVSSSFSAQTLMRATSVANAAPRTKIVRMGVPSSATTSASVEPSSAIAAFCKETEKRDFFLFVGRLSSEKGADRVIDLAKRHPNTRFALAGKGPLENSLQSSAPPNVAFLGYVSNGERQMLFERAKALLICSRVPENSPVILFESHETRIPVVFEKGGGAEEIVKWLERDGCAWQDFDPAKTFERRGKSLEADAFVRELDSLLTEPFDVLQ